MMTTALMVDAMLAVPPLRRHLDRTAAELVQPPGMTVDFSRPAGTPALVGPHSVSWQVFKNPVSLFIGGVAAVLLELAEPSVRSGVWDHSSFRSDPVTRLKRTGQAAMVTVYAARPQTEAMIAGIVRRHARVTGTTPDGTPYEANDPVLLTWVQATATFGFLQAYHRYVRPLDQAERDTFYGEASEGARLFGATDPPLSEAALHALFDRMGPRLERSAIIDEFLGLMRTAPAFPAPLRPLQRLLVRAAIDLLPDWFRKQIDLGPEESLSTVQRLIVVQAARAADRLALPSSAPVQASVRMGLPPDFLFRRR